MAKASILEITKSGEEYMFIFTPSGKPLSGAAERACPVRVHPQAVAAFCRSIQEAVAAANKNPLKPNINLEPFVTAGRGLFLTLLPDKDPLTRELLGILRRLRTPLLIKTDDSSLFWELLFDETDQQFFGLRFRMSRCLRTRGLPSAPPRRRDEWRWLVISSPAPDEKHAALSQAAKEAERLVDWLGERKVKHLDCLEGAEATFDAVLAMLARSEYDVIHYAGHTELDRKSGEYGLLLHGGRLFPASSIRTMVRGNPIVFLNGCWTGAAKGLENAPGSAEGLTDAFLAAGAQLVVGSLFEAPDAGARAFAEKFYETVLDGEAVGEAIRQARLHVRGKPEYGPAWACFVMYGDPCLRFNVSEDALQVLLQTVNLSRVDFQASCLRVIEQAVEYGTGGKLVGTPHLFAAMVDGEDRRVRSCIQKQGIRPDELRDAFTEAFKEIKPSKRQPSKMAFSENAEAILKHARESARAPRGIKISEADLIEGFVRKIGGTTGEILDKLGIDAADFLIDLGNDAKPSEPKVPLLPPKSPATRSRKEKDAPLSLERSDFSTEAWAGLARAMAIAQESGSKMVGTPQLFMAMLEDKESPLAKALRRFGLRVAKSELGISGNGHTTLQQAPSPVQFSKSVSDILDFAREFAKTEARARITARDLLVGFVRQGGGTAGKLLLQKGIVLQALLSELFLESGAMNSARLSPDVQRVVQTAQEFARQKGRSVIGRRDVLHGMLAMPHSLLAKLLGEQGKDPAQLADLLDVRLIGETHDQSTASSSTIPMGSALVTVFCLAEFKSTGPGQKLLNEAGLLAPFLELLSTDLKEFLIREGVRWRDLIQNAQRLAQENRPSPE